MQGVFFVDSQEILGLRGAFLLSQLAARQMIKQKQGGKIIFVSSVHEDIPFVGYTAYCASKGATRMLMRNIAMELAEYQINVNNIAPGFVRSNDATERQWASYGEEGQRALVDRIALRRLGTADDIAYGVLFFASEYAGWITGQVLSIDGGK